MYYVTGHVAAEADATHFISVNCKGTPGKVIIMGVEDDEYIILEVRTDSGMLHNMPQNHLEHHPLTADATVDGNSISMLADNNSKDVEAPLSVVNTRGFDLPKTGDSGTLLITVSSIVMMAAAGMVLILASREMH